MSAAGDGVDGRLLLAVRSLHSCSGVGVGGVTSQPFTLGAGLGQGCVLSSPLLFIVYIRGHQPY